MTYNQITRFMSGISALQPLLQPKQIPAGEDGAKPPTTEPLILTDQIGAVSDLTTTISQELASDDAQAALDQQTLHHFQRAIDHIRAGETAIDPDPSKKFRLLRRGLKGLAYLTGSLITAVSGGVMINILTAPDAAVTLAQRLKPLFDLILSYFM